MTLVQYRALVVLAGRGPQRSVDLADELGGAPSTLTRMLGRLYRKRLIRRYRRDTQRRATWVALSESGRDLVGTVMQNRRAAIASVVDRLDSRSPQVQRRRGQRAEVRRLDPVAFWSRSSVSFAVNVTSTAVHYGDPISIVVSAWAPLCFLVAGGDRVAAR